MPVPSRLGHVLAAGDDAVRLAPRDCAGHQPLLLDDLRRLPPGSRTACCWAGRSSNGPTYSQPSISAPFTSPTISKPSLPAFSLKSCSMRLQVRDAVEPVAALAARFDAPARLRRRRRDSMRLCLKTPLAT